MRQLLHVPEMGILVPLVGLVLGFSLLHSAFLNTVSIVAMLRAMAFIGIIAVAQTWLMVAGEIDLSVGSVAGLCAVAAGVAAGLAAGGLTAAEHVRCLIGNSRPTAPTLKEPEP